MSPGDERVRELESINAAQAEVINLFVEDLNRLKVENLRYDPETIWLARGIYSETNDSTEMVYVGRVIQNRYNLKYNGKSTYREIVLDPRQFSGFNHDNNRSQINRRVSITDPIDTWQTALNVALYIRTTPPDKEFTATHFYSPISMVPKWSKPRWAEHLTPIQVQGIEPSRFRFYIQ